MMGVELVTLEQIVERSDFITVHMPLTAETRNMFHKENLAKMKKGVRLVNCARGGIINEADLAEAVKAGTVAGAAIDVFTAEPLPPDHPLLGLPGVVGPLPGLSEDDRDAQRPHPADDAPDLIPGSATGTVPVR